MITDQTLAQLIVRNVARTWCYETGLAAGVELATRSYPLLPLVFLPISNLILLPHYNSALPINEYFSYFGPEYELDVKSSNMVVRLASILPLPFAFLKRNL
jgi:histone deacetylase 1/2